MLSLGSDQLLVHFHKGAQLQHQQPDILIEKQFCSVSYLSDCLSIFEYTAQLEDETRYIRKLLVSGRAGLHSGARLKLIPPNTRRNLFRIFGIRRQEIALVYRRCCRQIGKNGNPQAATTAEMKNWRSTIFLRISLSRFATTKPHRVISIRRPGTQSVPERLGVLPVPSTPKRKLRSGVQCFPPTIKTGTEPRNPAIPRPPIIFVPEWINPLTIIALIVEKAENHADFDHALRSAPLTSPAGSRRGSAAAARAGTRSPSSGRS